MKRTLILSALLSITATALAESPCRDEVEVGDKMRQVVEKCGEPRWREITVNKPGQRVEIVRGLDSLQTHPVNPDVLEKWYYPAGPDKRVVIEILDYGVLSIRQLDRDPGEPVNMD